MPLTDQATDKGGADEAGASGDQDLHRKRLASGPVWYQAPVPLVVVVRHGATEWSDAGRHTSRTDLPLTDAGRTVATSLTMVLAHRTWAQVLTSPRLRARETAALAGLGERAVVQDDLAEWDYGDYEGLTTEEIRRLDPGWSIWERGAPAGESPADVARRVDAVIARLRSSSGDVVVFSHGHLLRALAARWVGLGVEWGRALTLGAGRCGALGYERETPALLTWNAPGL